MRSKKSTSFFVEVEQKTSLYSGEYRLYIRYVNKKVRFLQQRPSSLNAFARPSSSTAGQIMSLRFLS